MFMTSMIQLPPVLRYTDMIYCKSPICLWLWNLGNMLDHLPVVVGSQVANASGYRALLWVPMKAHVWRWSLIILHVFFCYSTLWVNEVHEVDNFCMTVMFRFFLVSKTASGRSKTHSSMFWHYLLGTETTWKKTNNTGIPWLTMNEPNLLPLHFSRFVFLSSTFSLPCSLRISLLWRWDRRWGTPMPEIHFTRAYCLHR